MDLRLRLRPTSGASRGPVRSITVSGDRAMARRSAGLRGIDGGPSHLLEDGESAVNRTMKAPQKTWQKPAPRGIRRP